MRNSLKQGLLFASVAAIVSPVAVAAQEQRISIPPGTLQAALDRLARQSGVQIIFRPADVRGRKTGGAKGARSVEQALQQLLAGTGLALEKDGTGAFAVTGGNAPAGVPADFDPAIPEILVTANRSQNVDIKRTQDDTQPYIVLSSEDIESSQATDVTDFLRKRLPMSTSAMTRPISDNTLSRFPEISPQIDLRGLGSNQTLILIDGRRAPRALKGGANFTQADIGNIPLSSIERIEILPSTAGAIYGGNAVGGVINIIRKRDYSGIDATVGYDGTFRGGGELFRAELNGGFALEGGRTRVSLAGSYIETQPLYVKDRRGLVDPGRERYFTNGARFDPFFFPPVGNRANIVSLGDPLTLDDGSPLGALYTTIPAGYAGPASDNGQALLANAGTLSTGLSNDAAGLWKTLSNRGRSRSANINIRREFSSAVDAFADFAFADSRSTTNVAARPVFLPPDDPGNPFQQFVMVAAPAPGLDLPYRNKTQELSANAGLIAKLGHGWTGTVEYGWARSRNSTSFFQLTDAYERAAAAGEIDLLRDPALYAVDYAPYLAPYPFTEERPFTTIQQIASARAAGSLFRLPAGPLSVSLLAERAIETAKLSTTIFTQPAFFPGDPDMRIRQGFPERSQARNSGYAEIRVPLFSSRNARPFLQELELQGSVRYDAYATRVGEIDNPGSPDDGSLQYLVGIDDPLPDFRYQTRKFDNVSYMGSFRWSPVKDIAFRGSYATGFLPPSINQLSPTFNYDVLFGYRDPKRGDQSISQPYTLISGGNPELAPEQSRSLSAGVIVTPHFLPGFRLSADYTRIRKRDEIGGIGPQAILDNEDVLEGRVIRADPTPADIAAGYAGRILSLDASLANVSRSASKAYDFQADYTLESPSTGTFRLYAAATLQQGYWQQLLPASDRVQKVAFIDGPLRWRGNAGIDWTRNGLSLSWSAQYYDGHSLRRSTQPEGEFLLGQIQGAERMPSQTYHDVSIRYAFGDDAPNGLSGLQFAFGIQNVFDKKPPSIAGDIINYSPYGDPRLRRFTLRLTKHFGK